ncbi:hypothetical protein, partial [Escherichia coli]|uniref:hypothetical protein n=1 Tax=Escherichia coli TaxID=562 RepID=UPI0013D234CF
AQRRIAGIEKDRDHFIAQVRELCRRPGIDMADEDPFVAARKLRTRLNAAQQAHSRADQARQALERRRQILAEARQALSGREAALAP